MIVVKNLASVEGGFDAWLLQAEEQAVEVYKGLATRLFKYIVHETPEWSGNVASNWNLSVGTPDFSSSMAVKDAYRAAHKGKENKGPPYQKGGGGNPAAYDAAEQHLAAGLAKVTNLNFSIFITNATPFRPNGKTLADLEFAPEGWVRSVNMPSGVMARAGSWVAEQFALVGPANIGRLLVSTL